MMTTTTEPRAWIGCLACYNAGRLVGEWVDGTEAGDRAQELADLALNDPDERAHHVPDGGPHEEWWVMDHEGFAGLLTGECSPAEAQRLAEVLDSLPDYVSAEAFAAFVSNIGADVDDLSGFEEAYAGEYDSERAFAEELAEDLGAVPDDLSWPASYIDWDAATRDLFIGDYWSAAADGGGVYVFRNI